MVEALTLDLLLSFGLPFLALIFLLEGALIGKLLPTDFILPAALVLFATASRDFILILIICSVSSTVGQLVLYRIINKHGESALDDLGWLNLSESKLDRAEKRFEKNGGYAIIVSNMLPGVRGFLTIPAALENMNQRVFTICSFSGTFFYHLVLVMLAVGFASVIF